MDEIAQFLAELFYDRPRADGVLQSAGFPRHRWPTDSPDIGTFWRQVLQLAYDGVMPTCGGATAVFLILGEARRKFPHNPHWPAVVARVTETQEQQVRVAERERPVLPPAPPPPGVLVIGGNPRDRAPVRTNREYAVIQEVLGVADLPVRFQVHPPQLATRPHDVIGLLRHYQPTVVHFCGHAEFTGSLAAVILENADGEHWPLEAEALADYLRIVNAERRVVQAVVLNACATRTVAETIEPLVDLVVATDHAIADTSALGFAQGFYRALGQGLTADLALTWGRADARIAAPGGGERNGHSRSPNHATDPTDPNAFAAWPRDPEQLRRVRIPRE